MMSLGERVGSGKYVVQCRFVLNHIERMVKRCVAAGCSNSENDGISLLLS